MALPPHLADLEGRLASRVDEALAGFRRAFEARLRGATERLLAEATDVPQPAFEGLFAEVERAALDEAPRQEGAQAAVASLVDAARAFDRAASQRDVLTALVAAGRSAAERLVLLLVRGQRLVAFESAGCNGRLALGEELAFEGDLRERLDAAAGCLALGAADAAEVAAQFGLDASGEAVVVPLVLRDKIAALLWADRQRGVPDLASLQLLSTMAAQRLELQALSSRSYTPTLYDGAAAPGAPLPLWSELPVEEPEPALRPAGAAAALEETPSFEVVAVESEESVVEPLEGAARSEAEVEALLDGGADAGFDSEPAALSAAPAALEAFAPAASDAEQEQPWSGAMVEIDTSGDAVAELFEAAPETEEPVTPADAAAFAWQEADEEETPAAVEPEPPSWSLEAEPEPSAPAEAAAAPPLAVEAAEPEKEMTPEPPPEPTSEPAGEADVLRTMRMPILSFPLAGAARAPEEATAPLRIEDVTPPVAGAKEGATTHEFPAPATEPAAPLASGESVSDIEATALSRRSPLAPAEPSPSIAVPPRMTVPLAPVAPPAPIAPPATPSEDPMDRTASRLRSTEVAPPPDLQGPGRAFLSGRAQRAAAEQPTHEEAKRLARLLISEIKLYNEEQVLEGRRNRDLYHRLKEDIDRSRQIYDERVDSAVRQSSDYFQQELVRSLAGGDPRALGI